VTAGLSPSGEELRDRPADDHAAPYATAGRCSPQPGRQVHDLQAVTGLR